MNKQVDFIKQHCDTLLKPSLDATVWKLYVDGASRNNPGLAGAGVCLYKNSLVAYQEGFFLGVKTNNQAEYLALLVGLFQLKKVVLSQDAVYVISDSELLTQQLRGNYRVKKDTLKLLYSCALTLLSDMNYSLCHVKRELNEQADKLANQGIDNGTPLPEEFIFLLRTHGIEL